MTAQLTSRPPWMSDSTAANLSKLVFMFATAFALLVATAAQSHIDSSASFQLADVHQHHHHQTHQHGAQHGETAHHQSHHHQHRQHRQHHYRQHQQQQTNQTLRASSVAAAVVQATSREQPASTMLFTGVEPQRKQHQHHTTYVASAVAESLSASSASTSTSAAAASINVPGVSTAGAFGTDVGDNRKPLKLTLITSSGTIGNSDRTDDTTTQYRRRADEPTKKWSLFDRFNDYWSPALIVPPSSSTSTTTTTTTSRPSVRALQHHRREPTTTTTTTKSTTATRQLTGGRHVCVDHSNPLPLTLPDVGHHQLHSSLFPDIWQAHSNDFFGYQQPPTAAATTKRPIVYKCCPGWAQVSRQSHGCTKPLCAAGCLNGGKCVKPDVCSCSAGYSGAQCQVDRNECLERKPCDHYCHNTPGSFYCTCRPGFALDADRESCRRTTSAVEPETRRRDDAFEARDMENDVMPDYGGRIEQIEKTALADRQLAADLGQKLHIAVSTVQNLKHRLELMEQRMQEMGHLREQLSAQEAQSRRLEYIVDKLYKCRNSNSVFCSLQ